MRPSKSAPAERTRSRSGSARDEWCPVVVTGRECGKETVATVSVICVNEYPDTQRLCGEHVRIAQRRGMRCARCKATGQGEHLVRVTRVVWD